MIRILLVDDQALVRAGFRLILDAEDDLEVVGEAADGGQAVTLATELAPDLVLMDIRMPGLNGIEATRKIKAAWPEIGVLILTVYDDEQYIYALIDAGAAGYLLKTTEAAELGDAIQRVRQGEAVLSPAVTEKVLKRLLDRDGAPVRPAASPLSEREREILGLVATGASNKARRLNGLSPASQLTTSPNAP